MSTESEFLNFSAEKLIQLVGRIETCVDRLTPEQLWRRGSERENAVGNLMLHLAGNVRQWILAGIGGAPDHRDRDAEFAARDGAGALVVTSEEFARKRGLEVLATIVSQGYVADDFAYLARTPAKAGAIALEKAGKTIEDVERVELNEAFASVAVNSTKVLGVDPDRVNVNGGAVALGHPIGASGARILATMIHELRRNGGGLGLAAICSGGGQGDAILIEV